MCHVTWAKELIRKHSLATAYEIVRKYSQPFLAGWDGSTVKNRTANWYKAALDWMVKHHPETEKEKG
jgi:hypothetical protein